MIRAPRGLQNGVPGGGPGGGGIGVGNRFGPQWFAAEWVNTSQA